MPENSYIYANPKGEGIGKPTEINIEKKSFIKRLDIRYPKGEKYYAPGDPKSVYIYRKKVQLPFTYEIEKNAIAGTYTIKANASLLLCSQGACFPVDRSIDIPVSVVSNSSDKKKKKKNEFILHKSNDAAINIQITGQSISGLDDIKFTPNYPDRKVTGILQAIIFGLIAGFILNFMPCVLPVVSLKIMSFVLNAAEEKRIIAWQGFFFSAGIIASFIFLAVLAAFFGYKWGALFQSESFVIIMASFIFSMALSLFGIFNFSISFSGGRLINKKRGLYADSFFKGIAATVLATPCSGPFLGATIAWTLTMPPAYIFMVFLSVGIGMAIPYMLLSINPSFLRFIPKPGEWMNNFKTAMGFLLMLTVVYLFSLLDNSMKTGLALFLLFLSIGLWQLGKFGDIDKERWKRYSALIILLIIIAAGYIFSFKYMLNEREYSYKKTDFSIERILDNKSKGMITVVNFTADWCPNCSLVEKMALQNSDVEKFLARDHIEFMTGDITKKYTEAEALMNMLGSSSIPLLAVFPPGEGFSSPICLRDIYSSRDVIDALTLSELKLKEMDY
jgi:thiol:disulfide interchange protein DsbD